MSVCSYMGAEGVSVLPGVGVGWGWGDWHLLISLMSKVGCAVVLKAHSIKSTKQSPLGLGQPA